MGCLFCVGAYYPDFIVLLDQALNVDLESGTPLKESLSDEISS